MVTALRGARQTSNGPITGLNRTEIEGVASINRDIRDLARRDPFATIDLTNSRTIEVAGQNGRLNRFSVDGVQFSDDFGLNNGGLPTSRGPVPFDAIEQFAVRVAPFDISEGDFQGGAINVVLRSGTNQLHGSAFFTHTDDSLTGSRVHAAIDRKSASISSPQQYGGLIAGPIIRTGCSSCSPMSRLNETDPFDDGVGPGFANQVPGITLAQIDQVSAIAKTVYNYDTLGLIQNAAEPTRSSSPSWTGTSPTITAPRSPTSATSAPSNSSRTRSSRRRSRSASNRTATSLPKKSIRASSSLTQAGRTASRPSARMSYPRL